MPVGSLGRRVWGEGLEQWTLGGARAMHTSFLLATSGLAWFPIQGPVKRTGRIKERKATFKVQRKSSALKNTTVRMKGTLDFPIGYEHVWEKEASWKEALKTASNRGDWKVELESALGSNEEQASSVAT